MVFLWEIVRDSLTVIGALTVLFFLWLLWEDRTYRWRVRRWDRQQTAERQAHQWKPPHSTRP